MWTWWLQITGEIKYDYNRTDFITVVKVSESIGRVGPVVVRSTEDREFRGSNPTLPKVNFSGHKKKWISDAPLDQGVIWNP